MSTEPGSSSPSWRSRPQDEIVWAQFETEFIAYHRPSGTTHFLNAGSHALLTDILIEANDLSSILEVFTSEHTDSNPDVYREKMVEMLSRIEELGLIERV